MSSNRVRTFAVLYNVTAPLAASAHVYRGCQVGVKYGTNTVDDLAKGSTRAAPMKALGAALEERVKASGDVDVPVELNRPVKVEYLANGNSLTLASNFLGKCYYKDSATITDATNDGGGNYYVYAGIVWDVDSVKGVGFEPADISQQALLS